MNALGIALLWCVLQVTLAGVAGAVVYLIARRTGWAAGRMATIASLAMVLLLSAAAVSPWPSWFSVGALSDEVVGMTETSASLGNDLPETNIDPLVAELPALPDASGPLNLAFWRDVWAEMQRAEATADTQVVPVNHAWRWPAIVAAIFLATAAIGILRLIIAWFAVRQLDGKSTRIADSRLTELAATISRDLSLSTPLVLKESPELQTAATFGWRRPVILLPEAWRDWPEEELRAVLAHEMAHIRSGDFLTWLMAQFIVATHFYHPLVHWLAGRLRLEQELAADATAAQFAGGRETYLQSLATLTLRADHLRPSWATQTFLPTRSMFVRRIEMLKRTKAMSSERPSGKVRLAVVGTLVAIGIFAVGLRAPGPIGATPVVAAEAVVAKESVAEQAKVKVRVWPWIAKTVPAVGATDVDPDLKEITVTFDRDMTTGKHWSWTGNEKTFMPPTPQGADVHWRDSRTCVLPVKLDRGEYYRVGINSKSFHGFKNANGDPAPCSVIYFTTRGASKSAQSRVRVPKLVKYVPENGAAEVKATVPALRASFDLPMGGGMSWVGAGDRFPKPIPGKQAKWTRGGKTCVLPVQLEPGHSYQLGLNSEQHINFQSKWGVPLEPVEYHFQTTAQTK